MEREWVSMTLLDTERFVKNYQQNSRIEYRGILNGKKKKKKKEKGKTSRDPARNFEDSLSFFLPSFPFLREEKIEFENVTEGE